MDAKITEEFLKEKIKKLGWNIEYYGKELELSKLELKMFEQKLAELEMQAL